MATFFKSKVSIVMIKLNGICLEHYANGYVNKFGPTPVDYLNKIHSESEDYKSVSPSKYYELKDIYTTKKF